MSHFHRLPTFFTLSITTTPHPPRPPPFPQLQIRNNYVAVGRSMRHYEEQKFADWLERSNARLPTLLRRNVLRRRDQALEEEEEQKEEERKETVEMDLKGDLGFIFVFYGFAV